MAMQGHIACDSTALQVMHHQQQCNKLQQQCSSMLCMLTFLDLAWRGCPPKAATDVSEQLQLLPPGALKVHSSVCIHTLHENISIAMRLHDTTILGFECRICRSKTFWPHSNQPVHELFLLHHCWTHLSIQCRPPGAIIV